MRLLEFLNKINEMGVVDDRLHSWMGNSKVVDDNGEPLPVYHGTSSEDEFTELQGMSHFGTLDAAEQFVPSSLPDSPKRIYPVYLRIENPLEIEDSGEPHDDYEYAHAAAQALDKAGKYDAAASLVVASLGRNWKDETVWKYQHYSFSSKLLEMLKSIPLQQVRAMSDKFDNMSGQQRQEYYVSYLENLGYDGFTYINDVEDEGSRSWIPFHSNQIRYAYSESRLNEVDIGRTLYHGTTKERAREIEWNGLEPRVGDLVLAAYGDYEDDEDMDVFLRLQPLGFAADKSNFNKVMSAMFHHVEELLREKTGTYQTVTDDDLVKYGAILVFKEGEYDFTHRPDDDEQWHDNYDNTEHPRQVEPGDWYSDWPVKPSYVLTGEPMIRLLKRMGEWPRRYGARNATEKEIKSMMGNLVRVALKVYPDKTVDQIMAAVKLLTPQEMRKMYYDLSRQLTTESINEDVPYEWHGKHIVWDNGEFRISVDRPGAATYIVLWNDQNKKIGYLSTTSKAAGGLPKGKWLFVGEVEIEPRTGARGQGIAIQMYRALLNNMSTEYDGLVGYQPDIVNKRVDRIYKRLGAYEIPDYYLVPNPNKHQPGNVNESQNLTEGMSFYPAQEYKPKHWRSVFPSGWTSSQDDWDKVDDYKAQMDDDYEMPKNPEYRPEFDLSLTGTNMTHVLQDVLGFQTDDPNMFHIPIDQFLAKAQIWLQKNMGQTTPELPWREEPRQFKRQVTTDPATGLSSISGGPQGPKMYRGGRREGYDEQTIRKMVHIAQHGKERGATYVTAV
jgi:hypothetical protein